MAVRKDPSDLLKLLRRDERYKKLKHSFDTLPAFQIPIDQHMKDIEMLHKTRPVRLLNPSHPKFVDQVVKANTSDQASRSRVVAIMMECIRAADTLKAAVEAYREYVLFHYADDLKVYRTKDERVALVKAATSRFMRYVDRVTVLSKCCEVLVKDMDQAYWSMKLTAETYKIHAQRESSL